MTSAPLRQFAGLLLVLPLLACSSSGSSSSADQATTLACLVKDSTLGESCQYYEASGTDAVRTIASLRSGCTTQAGITMAPVASCPPGPLGGCKGPVTVKGGAVVVLTVTNFFYAGDGGFGPSSTAAVKSQCTSEGTTFVASP